VRATAEGHQHHGVGVPGVRGWLVGLVLLVLLVLLPGRHASAAPDKHPLVYLELDACLDVPREEVRRLIALELGAVAEFADTKAGDRTRVAALCQGGLIELRVDDPITGKALQRTIDLSEAPRARARLLALAMVELVSTSWTELETNPEPQVPPVGPRGSAESRHAAEQVVRTQSERSAFRRLRLVAFGGGQAFFSGPGVLGGAGLRLAKDHPLHLGWVADVQAHHGTATASLGTVAVDTVSFGAALVVHQAWSRLGLHVGIGLRGGAVRLDGTPRNAEVAVGQSGWAAWGGPMAQVSLGVVATRRLLFELGVESGFVVSSVGGLVAGVRELSLGGAWIGFQLGVGIFL